jgi:hypothetical protein
VCTCVICLFFLYSIHTYFFFLARPICTIYDPKHCDRLDIQPNCPILDITDRFPLHISVVIWRSREVKVGLLPWFPIAFILTIIDSDDTADIFVNLFCNNNGENFNCDETSFFQLFFVK